MDEIVEAADRRKTSAHDCDRASSEGDIVSVSINREFRFEHPVQDLLDAFVDPDFQDAKVRHVGGGGSKLLSLRHDEDTDQLVVVTRQKIHRDELPSIARRFAREPMYADREERWQLSPIWSTGEFDVDVPDAPMRSGGKLTVLSDGDDACKIKVRTYISVSAPLVSRSIERGMAENVADWLDDEFQFTAEWLKRG